MSLIIFGDAFSFPEGNAATNRVHTYAKGFYENGIRVHVICFGNEYNTISNGNINGINFYHPFNHKKRSNFIIIRSWQKLMKYFKTINLIIKINKNDKIIAFNCWTHILLTQFFAFLVVKYFKTYLILEHSEHPLRNYQSSYFRKIKGSVKSYIETNLCHGIFCISKYLIDFYIKRGVSGKKLFLVPSTVDTERFNTSFKPPFDFKYILYCGSLTLLKDGVDILIESFVKISEKHPDINLVLLGKGDLIKEELIIKELVMKLNIKSKIFFTGQLDRTKVPAYITNATILALSRPSSIVADAGFPSKVTEYLATGIPVVVTEVGEIPLYLRDKENAFLSKPDSIEAFADKLDYVLSNYGEAKEVGFRGKELTNTIFNYNFQAKRMIGYINSF